MRRIIFSNGKRRMRLKRVVPVLVAILALAVLGACSRTEISPTGVPDDTNVADATPLAANVVLPSDVCGDATVARLLSGQTTDVGTVKVLNDADSIHVAFSVTTGWRIMETHVAIVTDPADFPTNKPGNPMVGRFPLGDYLHPGVTEAEYSVSLEDLGVEPGDMIYVAAHAVVTNEFFEIGTAWGEGTRFTERRNWAMYIECEVQECLGRPSPGEDIVVFNDINPFDNTGMNGGVGIPNNHIMVSNLVDYTTAGPRGAGTVVWFDRGRNSVCGDTGECNDQNLSTMRTVITSLGYTITEINSTFGSITSIPADVKVIFLWNPLVAFTNDEINAFKLFASGGGRVVFIGEWDGYYGAGIALENEFLLNMGAVMTNIGDAVDCGYWDLPGTSLRPHQITAGMTAVRIACASVIVPGPDDYPLFYDSTNTLVLAGVAKIDTTPLPANMFVQTGENHEPMAVQDGLDVRWSTGHCPE
jgi:hypothetical protein